MKSLIKFIQESRKEEELFENYSSNLMKPSTDAFKLLDTIKAWLGSIGTKQSKLKNEMYSLTNKQDSIYLWKDFLGFRWNTLAVSSKEGKALLKKFGLNSGDDLVKFLFENKATLLDPNGRYKWDQPKYTTHILQFNKTKLEQEYDKWKNSKDAVQGHKWEDKDFDPGTVEREIVIYDRRDNKNMETTLVYPFKGMRGKRTEHQLNMLRMDWCYQCGYGLKKYYDAYTKLKDNYDKYGPAEYNEYDDTQDILDLK